MNTILLSIGYGRLHLVQTADWLAKAGLTVKLICGWVPGNPEGWLVRLCSKIVGRDLAPGMRKRTIKLENGGEVIPCAWADFLCEGLFLIERRIFQGRMHSAVATFAWKVFGWQTKRYLRKYAKDEGVVFHVRSGAGHGGAIEYAHKLGIPVVVDHSIAHPRYMEEHLRAEYERNRVVFGLGISSPFWEMVSKDCDNANILLVNSFFVRDTFVEQGYPPDKIKVVYLGTRPDFFGLRRVKAENRGGRTLKLLFTGGFGFRKGAEYVLEAMKILKDKAPVPFELDVVGDYSSAKGIIKKYAAYELPIIYHGQVPQDNLKQYLAQSDIYVFPSLAEGCACSGMEAMAAGLCVVATKESGFPIDDNTNGCFVPTKDAVSLSAKIMSLMNNPAAIDRMGFAAAELIRAKYTWECYTKSLKNLYRSITPNH